MYNVSTESEAFMTIQTFVDNFTMEIDQLYVKDTKGNYITAPGNKEFIDVEITKYNGFADLVFIV